jgi:hypothetical protein
MGLSKTQKNSQLKAHSKCYVCAALNLPNAGFGGYGDDEIQYDHYRARSLVGDKQADLVQNQWPIHAAKDGDTYQSDDYAKSHKRNCHAGKGNKFTGEEWGDFVTVYRKCLTTEYSDDLYPTRKVNDKKFLVTIDWDIAKQQAEFDGIKYPIMEQPLSKNNQWYSFSTVVHPSRLWVDRDVQSRPADKKRMAELAWHLRNKPLLSPILCRYADNKLLVFDGNHRLCAFVIARQNHAVPVVIFRGPEPDKFLEVVAEAHDKLTQKKYQYTDKAVKYSGMSEGELQTAVAKYGALASEQKAWEGLASTDVKVRLIGRVVQSFENSKKTWRHDWKKVGLSDPSFVWMIEYYSKIDAVSDPFDSDNYLRPAELENLVTLFSIFDEELFQKLSSQQKAKASLKTKWWKLAHKRLRTQLSHVIKNSMKLDNTPEKPAYSPEWDKYIKSQLRSAVIAWRNSPVWAGDTTANNEPDVDAALQKGGFTEAYLFK